MATKRSGRFVLVTLGTALALVEACGTGGSSDGSPFAAEAGVGANSLIDSSADSAVDALPCSCTLSSGGASLPMRCGDRGCTFVDGKRKGWRCAADGLVDDAEGCLPSVIVTPDGGPTLEAGPRPSLQLPGMDAGFEPERVGCTDDAGPSCSVSCPGNASCTCVSGKPCELPCGNTSACGATAIDCSPAASCALDCSGVSACQVSAVECGDGGCKLACSNTSACDDSTITCGDGLCEVDCSGQDACLDATIKCGKGPCRVTCAVKGPDQNVAIDCGDSVACVNGCN